MKKMSINFNFLTTVLFLALITPTFSQDQKWLMGYQCCSGSFGGMTIDFTSGSPLITTVNRNMPFDITNAVITDSLGNILFYTNGIYIANRLDDTLKNGSVLSTDPISLSYPFGLPIVQGTLILPFDKYSTKYNIFHLELSNDQYLRPRALFNTIIDMALDSGKGQVISLRNPIVQDTLVTGLITACRHANGRDWWIIAPKSDSNKYYKILSTPYNIFVQYQLLSQVTRGHMYEGSGQVCFSQDGSKYARFDPINGLVLMDFDRCSGNFSNPKYLDSTFFGTGLHSGGIAFSSSGRFLYLTTGTRLYQMDLSSSSLLNGLRLIDIYDGFNSPGPTEFFTCKLARNGEIYISTSSSTDRLHVIKFPDSLGIACGFEQHTVILPRISLRAILTQPNFQLGAETGTVCDSVILQIPNYNKVQYQLFPNPSNNSFTIVLNRSECNFHINIFNQLGSLEKQFTSTGCRDKIELDIRDLNEGVYYFNLESAQEILNGKFIVCRN